MTCFIFLKGYGNLSILIPPNSKVLSCSRFSLILEFFFQLQIVNRPFESSGDLVSIYSEQEVADVHTAVKGVVKLFQKKIYTLPSSIATLAYKIIVRHLANHYKRPSALEGCYSIRYVVSQIPIMNACLYILSRIEHRPEFLIWHLDLRVLLQNSSKLNVPSRVS